jgi:hypothetical protein
MSVVKASAVLAEKTSWARLTFCLVSINVYIWFMFIYLEKNVCKHKVRKKVKLLVKKISKMNF